MKRTITLILALAMLLSLAACSAPATETAAQAATPTVSEAATLEPTEAPTPTPVPTLSPEEITLQELYQEYKLYWERYGDEASFHLLIDMYYAGEITWDQIAFLEQSGFVLVFDDYSWSIESHTLYYAANFLNGKYELSEEYVDHAWNSVYYNLQLCAGWEKPGYIGLLDSPEERESVDQAIQISMEFFSDPTEENRERMEDAFFSENIKPGGIEIVFTWLNSYGYIHDDIAVMVNGKTYDWTSYIWDVIIEKYGKTYIERVSEAYNTLIDLNSTPNSEKACLELPFTPEILTSDELADLSSLSEVEQLKYFWKNYHDKYAALRLKQLFDEGKITESDYSGDIADFASSCTSYRADRLQNAADSLNNPSEMSASDFNDARLSLQAFFLRGYIPVSLFDTTEKRARIVQGINLIQNCINNPSNDNTLAFETFIVSDDLTDGEFVFLYKFFQYYDSAVCLGNQEINVGGKKYSPFSYLQDRKIKDGMSMEELYIDIIGMIKVEDEYGWYYDFPALYEGA